MKPTPARMKVLELTKQDVVLQIGGLDGRKVRKDVIRLLLNEELVKRVLESNLLGYPEYEITVKGLEYLKNNKPKTKKVKK